MDYTKSNYSVNKGYFMAKKTNTGIPGLSFSWRRALGITQAKRDFTKKTGIPTTKSGIERRIGSAIIKAIFGKK